VVVQYADQDLRASECVLCVPLRAITEMPKRNSGGRASLLPKLCNCTRRGGRVRSAYAYAKF
jgi:hypothetical protein